MDSDYIYSGKLEWRKNEFCKGMQYVTFSKIIWLTVVFSQAFRESILDNFKEMSLCFVICVLKYA